MEQPSPIETFEIVLREKRHEYGEVFTFIFEPLRPIFFQAGQYVHMRIPGVPPSEKSVREFSFASAPGDDMLWFSVNTKSGSPFQEALKNLPVGEKVSLFKIKGHMTIPEKEGPHLVLIAHGVGVAPFRSILRDLTNRKIPLTATLMQIDRDHFLYEKELTALSFEQHRITREKIDDTLLQVRMKYPSAIYYVAGAPTFVEEMVEKLQKDGIRGESIQTDIFKGLKDD